MPGKHFSKRYLAEYDFLFEQVGFVRFVRGNSPFLVANLFPMFFSAGF